MHEAERECDILSKGLNLLNGECYHANCGAFHTTKCRAERQQADSYVAAVWQLA